MTPSTFSMSRGKEGRAGERGKRGTYDGVTGAYPRSCWEHCYAHNVHSTGPTASLLRAYIRGQFDVLVGTLNIGLFMQP